jgi:hypothetical protein
LVPDSSQKSAIPDKTAALKIICRPHSAA